MHRFLERLDSAASTIVPVAYLTGLLLGTMAYFAGVTLDAGLAVGVALALAAELHSFLEQRRCRALWAACNRASDDDVRERLAGQLRTHIIILAALVTFSAVNATAFAAETWHPAPGFLPVWLQIGIRGAVVPVLFLLTGALSPLTVNASDELAAASRHMLHRTIRATVKQWNARIERARKRGVDLAPVAVSLMLDAGDLDGARRVQLIAEGLSVAETGASTPALAAPAPDSQPTRAQDAILTRDPAHMPSDTSVPPAPAQAPVRSDSDPSTPPDDTPPGGGSNRSRSNRRRSHGKRPAQILRLQPDSVEQRIRAALREQPTASVRQLAKLAGVSTSSASKWRRILASERTQREAASK